LINPIIFGFTNISSIPMTRTVVQFYDFEKYLTEIGGIWKAISGIAGIIIIPLIQYYFYLDLCDYFIGN
jgi:hypothetical protein